MVVLVTGKHKEDPIKMKARKLTRHRNSDTAVSVEIRLKFELIQAFMAILITCKNEDDPIKMKALES